MHTLNVKTATRESAEQFKIDELLQKSALHFYYSLSPDMLPQFFWHRHIFSAPVLLFSGNLHYTRPRPAS